MIWDAILAAINANLIFSISTNFDPFAELKIGSDSPSRQKIPIQTEVWKLLKLVAKEWPLLIQASICLVVAAISDVLIPHYISETISHTEVWKSSVSKSSFFRVQYHGVYLVEM